MAERNVDRSDMKYEVMDVTDMKYPDNFFDIAIDKSTIDALLCGDNAYKNVARMTKEVQRVLKPRGVYVAISYGKPESRIDHFERQHLSFDTKIYALYPVETKNDKEKEEKSHYIYVCWKKEDADQVCSENFEKVLVQIQKEQELEAAAHIVENDEQDDQKQPEKVQKKRGMHMRSLST